MQQIPLVSYSNWVCTYLRSSLQLLAEFSVLLLLRLSIFMALLSSKSIRCNIYKSKAKFKSHLFYHFKGLNSNKIRQREQDQMEPKLNSKLEDCSKMIFFKILSFRWIQFPKATKINFDSKFQVRHDLWFFSLVLLYQ